MTRPVELIVANTLHEVAENIEQVEMLGGGPLSAPATARLHDDLARRLLCDIAHGARMETVARALAAAGVCGGADGIAQRLAAAREARAADARLPETAPSTASAPAPAAATPPSTSATNPGADAPTGREAPSRRLASGEMASEAPQQNEPEPRASGFVLNFPGKG